MFCGIVEEIGQVAKIARKANLTTIVVKAKTVLPGVKSGDSVSVNGVCLTVASKSSRSLSFDVMKETLEKSNLGRLKSRDKVNLERAMKVGERINGHFVTGHIDGQGRIHRIVREKNYAEFYISMPKQLTRYVVVKGSICVEGASLTVGKVGKNYFSFYMIPYTHRMTTLGQRQVGDYVNVETDMLAKYIFKWT